MSTSPDMRPRNSEIIVRPYGGRGNYILALISSRYVHPTEERTEGAFTRLESYNAQTLEEVGEGAQTGADSVNEGRGRYSFRYSVERGTGGQSPSH